MQAILDRNADAILPSGYLIVETEVDFLRYADGTKSLLVRGADLCDWAEMFYRSREIPYQEGRSPIRELTLACPILSNEQATELYNLLGVQYNTISRPVTIRSVLQTLYPQRMWIDIPSVEHGATWLVWLIMQPLPASLQPMLTFIATQWQEQTSGPEAILYQVTDTDGAMQVLLAWLGINDSKECEAFGEFSGEIPPSLVEKARVNWKHELITTHGQFIKQILARQAPQRLKFLATELATEYFVKHPADLTVELYRSMATHLNRSQQRELSRFIAPSAPTIMPNEPSTVQEWYRTSYLPYRLWQEQYGNDAAQQLVQSAANEFALWYLEQYPKGLVGGSLTSHISFNRSGKLASQCDTYVTLLVVLDGLHVSDSQYLLQAIQRVTIRLTMAQDSLVFAPLPTITEFCKDALMKGILPAQAPQYEPLGKILPEKRSPVELLQNAKPGQLYLWRIQEPDATYHNRNSYQTLQRDVESQLDGIANKIADIVNAIVQGVMLRIVITTDHGRLLANSQRVLPVPTGMEPHGRTAYGEHERIFPASGYAVEEEIVYLHRDRFGLPTDVAIALTEKAFLTKDGKTGTELYAHGGLYPEEVIIPWLVFIRDLQAPEILISLSGKGRAKTRGRIHLRVRNLSEMQVKIVSITLQPTVGPVNKILVRLDCPPTYESEFSLECEIWPTQQEVQGMSSQIELQLPGERELRVTADVALESEEMYTKNQSILEGLDL